MWLQRVFFIAWDYNYVQAKCPYGEIDSIKNSWKMYFYPNSSELHKIFEDLEESTGCRKKVNIYINKFVENVLKSIKY